ncbi:YegP family protein [Pseudarthrobacter polychromogenes]|uniref:DUF1508 domain-containing protein n=1 Tax=Pseudarthrobacter polychromogenes TaxID=1676 RepID=A0ABQ1X9M3_9MICC|nr:DUF1508 domain-containing protein [Pseudarthrobacter polychromogenes]MBD1592200.1 DUF1508 domain-containing protein [Arthrobacter sp. S1_S22]GGG84766.1 hypothetical protein GCM10011577_03020 [Pseudarthrobacter polychromogenes]
MAGTFELFADEDSRIRFRLVAPDGTVLAVSGQYPDKYQAAAAIEDVRECAGTGLISDLAPAPNLARTRTPKRPHHVRPRLAGKANSLGAA